MLQEQTGRKRKGDDSARGKSRDVKRLKERAHAAAHLAMEGLEAAEEESEALKLSKASISRAAHEHEHIEEATAKKQPKRMCLRRKVATPVERRKMHGGCGGL